MLLPSKLQCLIAPNLARISLQSNGGLHGMEPNIDMAAFSGCNGVGFVRPDEGNIAMGKQQRRALKISREANFADWYQEVIEAADMAETSGVRGCMIIKPWGYKIWELLQRYLDCEIKATGHENCYFPIFIPLDLIEKEAAHVEGFAKEMAVVTHHRLENRDGKLVPAAPLEAPLVVRPTSETMVAEAFARWIQSYRDLPVKINQWANVVRWELRPRAFLRTSEFLWQEGHTAHATAAEAIEETRLMLGVYRHIVEECMAIPVIAGVKSAGERFPGADDTHTIEAMMQDGRALQAGTSHYLGQNFSRAAHITFQDRDGEERLVHTTSWGASTRLIGALIMVHADDDGLRLPPRMAPYQVVIVPIIRDEASRNTVIQACRTLVDRLSREHYSREPVRSFVDMRDDTAANKRWNWIKKGVPLVCEIGPRDIEDSQVSVHKRLSTGAKATVCALDAFVASVSEELDTVQRQLYSEAEEFRKGMTCDDIQDFGALKAFFESGGGFVRAKWSGDPTSEAALRELGVTVRCLPYDQTGDQGRCVVTGAPATTDALFARAY